MHIGGVEHGLHAFGLMAFCWNNSNAFQNGNEKNHWC